MSKETLPPLRVTPLSIWDEPQNQWLQVQADLTTLEKEGGPILEHWLRSLRSWQEQESREWKSLVSNMGSSAVQALFLITLPWLVCFWILNGPSFAPAQALAGFLQALGTLGTTVLGVLLLRSLRWGGEFDFLIPGGYDLHFWIRTTTMLFQGKSPGNSWNASLLSRDQPLSPPPEKVLSEHLRQTILRMEALFPKHKLQPRLLKLILKAHTEGIRPELELEATLGDYFAQRQRRFCRTRQLWATLSTLLLVSTLVPASLALIFSTFVGALF